MARPADAVYENVCYNFRILAGRTGGLRVMPSPVILRYCSFPFCRHAANRNSIIAVLGLLVVGAAVGPAASAQPAQRDLGAQHLQHGIALQAEGNLPGALESYRAALEILAKANLDNADCQHD